MHLQKLSFNWSPRLITTCRSPQQAYSHPSPTYLSSASFPSPFLGTTKFSRGLIHASSLRPCNSTIFPQCSCPWNTEQCASPATQETSSVEECLFLADTHNLYEEVFFFYLPLLLASEKNPIKTAAPSFREIRGSQDHWVRASKSYLLPPFQSTLHKKQMNGQWDEVRKRCFSLMLLKWHL